MSTNERESYLIEEHLGLTQYMLQLSQFQVVAFQRFGILVHFAQLILQFFKCCLTKMQSKSLIRLQASKGTTCKPPSQSFRGVAVLLGSRPNWPSGCRPFWFPSPSTAACVPFHRSDALRWRICVGRHSHPDLARFKRIKSHEHWSHGKHNVKSWSDQEVALRLNASIIVVKRKKTPRQTRTLLELEKYRINKPVWHKTSYAFRINEICVFFLRS